MSLYCSSQAVSVAKKWVRFCTGLWILVKLDWKLDCIAKRSRSVCSLNANNLVTCFCPNPITKKIVSDWNDVSFIVKVGWNDRIVLWLTAIYFVWSQERFHFELNELLRDINVISLCVPSPCRRWPPFSQWRAINCDRENWRIYWEIRTTFS